MIRMPPIAAVRCGTIDEVARHLGVAGLHTRVRLISLQAVFVLGAARVALLLPARRLLVMLLKHHGRVVVYAGAGIRVALGRVRLHEAGCGLVQPVLGLGHDLDVARIQIARRRQVMAVVDLLVLSLALLRRHRLLTQAIVAMVLHHRRALLLDCSTHYVVLV